MGDTPVPAAADVTHILGRFEPGWHPALWVEPGWYRLIVELDAALAEIEPDYVLHQVKEKFGGLRVYFELPSPQMACCRTFHATHPAPSAEDADYELWLRRFDDHNRDEEHASALEGLARHQAERDERLERMRQIVAGYEARSLTVCEVTGRHGRLMRKGGTLKTLCDDFREQGWGVA
jgi:hypothetical protein